MIWILVTVLVCLVVVLAQLLLMYQKRAARLKIAQNPVRKQIDTYKAKLTELGEEVRDMAGTNLKQLRLDLAEYQRRSGRAANLTAELDSEAQAWAAEREEEEALEAASPPDEDDGSDSDDDESGAEDDLLGGRHEASMKVETERTSPVELVRAIRHDLEETYEYIEGLRTDAVIVQQTVERLGPKDKSKANGA